MDPLSTEKKYEKKSHSNATPEFKAVIALGQLNNTNNNENISQATQKRQLEYFSSRTPKSTEKKMRAKLRSCCQNAYEITYASCILAKL
jgi:hypothetical protein